jgi:hypothetical protein
VVPQASGAEQVEEDRAAAEEGLDVAVEPFRIKTAELREKLPLSAGPFEQRPNGGRLEHC